MPRYNGGMGKSILLFLDVVSGNAQIIVTSIFGSIATLIGVYSHSQQMPEMDFILKLLLIAYSIPIIQVAVRFALEKRKLDFSVAINKLIGQGNDLRNPFLDYMRLVSDDANYKVVLQQLETWKRNTEKAVSNYNADLLSRIVVHENPGNHVRWIDERIQKLRELNP
jgi:hypothetical protein